MKDPKVLILVGYGINCDYETQHAFELLNTVADRVHVNELIDNKQMLEDYQILFIPGGFSYGDELGAGKVLANKLMLNLGDEILDFIKDGKLIGGHCNGAQVLVKAGLVPATDGKMGEQQATLTVNNTNRYEDRLIYLKNVSTKCVWTRDLPIMQVPIAHGEGKFITSDEKLIDKMKENDQIALLYVKPDGSPAKGEFPWNPNGSIADIAGICDPSGRVFAQMPHPERYLSLVNHPQWTRIVRQLLLKDENNDINEIDWAGEGILVFKNAVEHARKHLI